MEKFRLIKVYNLFYASRQKGVDGIFIIKKCQVEILGLPLMGLSPINTRKSLF